MPPDLEAVRRVLARPPAHQDAPRRAAVAVVLTPDFDLLFMRRAEYAGDPWSGHLSFPGGRVEGTDGSSLAAAIRETEEEVGIDLRDATYLGPLDTVGPASTPFALAIDPFVFALHAPPTPRLNAEVQSLHKLGLDDALSDVGRGPMPFEWKGNHVTLARVDFDGVRLWGLTLRVLDDLLDRLDGRGQGLQRMR